MTWPLAVSPRISYPARRHLCFLLTSGAATRFNSSPYKSSLPLRLCRLLSNIHLLSIRSTAHKLLFLAALLLLLRFDGAAAVTLKTGVEEAGDKSSESWTTWAKEKITEGLGLKHHEDGKAEAAVYDAAASEAGSYAAEKTKEAKELGKEAMGSAGEATKKTKDQTPESQTPESLEGKAKEVKSAAEERDGKEKKEEAAKEMTEGMKDAIMEKAEEAKEAAERGAKEAAERGAKEKAWEGTEKLKMMAKETVDAAKEKVEAAKEKVDGSHRADDEL